MTDTPEGRISIHLKREGASLVRAHLSSSRPLGAIRWFQGKRVGETLRMLPMLYRVCGVAQSAAAADAVESALGKDPPCEIVARREMLVLAETLREHLLRVFTGWSPVPPPAEVSLPRVMRLPAELSQFLFPETDPFEPGTGIHAHQADEVATWLEDARDLTDIPVLGCPAGEFLSLDSAEAVAGWAGTSDGVGARMVGSILDRGWGDRGQAALDPLPGMSAQELDARLSGARAEEFVAAPDWLGDLFETGAYARNASFPLIAAARDQWGAGLVTRLLARLVEIASLPPLLQRRFEESAGIRTISVATSPRPGTGIGQVEAARGRLVHRVVLDGDRVADYRMLAPTEWNFHPRGVVAQALSSLQPGPDLERLAGLMIEAIDPCVGYDLLLEE